MNRPIYLKPGEPRCTGAYCQRGRPCARQLAQHALGRPLTDFSLPTGTYTPADCSVLTGWPKFLSVEAAVEPATQREPKEWIGG